MPMIKLYEAAGAGNGAPNASPPGGSSDGAGKPSGGGDVIDAEFEAK